MANQTIEEQVAALAAEVQRLRDREEIRELLDRYAFLVDTGRWRDIPEAIFTEDAQDFHCPDVDPPRTPRGHDELHDFFRTAVREMNGSHHMLGNQHIEVHGDEAYSRTYALCSHWFPRERDDVAWPSEMTVALAYDDQLRRTESGWRVCERRIHCFGPHGLVSGSMLDAFKPRVGAHVYADER